MIFHVFYVAIGHIVCKICTTFLRLKNINMKENSVLFVSHPDDDTLFFHTAIKEEKPFVVLMTTGWSLKRLHDFIKAMKYYGVKFCVYSTNEHKKNIEDSLNKQVKAVLKRGNFERCMTHNEEGEYGHDTHCLVHKCVVRNAACEIFVPVSKERIEQFSLDPETVKEKEFIFTRFYKTETFVIDEYRTWMIHEKLERVVPNEKD